HLESRGEVPASDAASFVEGFADAWGKSDVDLLLALLTDDVVLRQPALPDVQGKAAARETFTKLFRAFPGLHAIVHRWAAHGDVVTFSTLFDSGFVMVFHPDYVKQVFRGSPEQLRAGEANAPLGPVLGARSVLLLDGAEHIRHRRLMLPPFHGERMREYESA